MQTITTKHLSATNTKGSRIKATASGGASHTIPFDYGLDGPQQAHGKAAESLINRLAWNGVWVGGTLDKTGDRMIWVNSVTDLKITR